MQLTRLLGVIFVSTLMCFAISLPAMGMEFSEFRKSVAKAVKAGKVPVDTPTFEWSGDLMAYDIYQSCDFSGYENPLEIPFSAMLTVESIRMHRYSSGRSRQFWNSVLPKVESKIEAMLQLINKGNSADDKLVNELNNLDNEIREIYQSELNALAEQEGKSGAHIKASPCSAYQVVIRARPENARIKYMRSGAYLMHICFSGTEPNWEDERWNTAPQGGEVTVADWTNFHVRWNSGRDLSGRIGRPSTGFGTLIADEASGFRWEK